jgi:hypothetical protein
MEEQEFDVARTPTRFAVNDDQVARPSCGPRRVDGRDTQMADRAAARLSPRERPIVEPTVFLDDEPGAVSGSDERLSLLSGG